MRYLLLLIFFVASSWAMKLEVEINPVEEQPGDHSGSDLLLPTSTTGNTAPLVESGDASVKGFRQYLGVEEQAATDLGGVPNPTVDPTDQSQVNTKVNAGPTAVEPPEAQLFYRMRSSEPLMFRSLDPKIQDLAEKAEKGIQEESSFVTFWLKPVKEWIKKSMQKPKMMKRLQGFVQDTLKKLTGVDSNLDLKIKEVAEKAERGIPVESELEEFIEEVNKNPKPMLKKRMASILTAIAAILAGVPLGALG